MSEESIDPDPREIALQMAEELSRGDFDAYMSHFARDAVWQSRFGIRLEGAAAIRSYTEEFVGAVEAYRAEVLEVVDLGGGVTFSIARHGGYPSGSASKLLEDHASVSVHVGGLVERMSTYSDIGEGRTTPRRLAGERA